MSWNVEFTDRARRDLRDILDYITYKFHEPQTAVKLVRQITKEILSLDNMPMRYRLYDNEPLKSQGLRCFPVKNYIVFITLTKAKIRFMPFVLFTADVISGINL